MPKTADDVKGVTTVVIPANYEVILDVSPPALPLLKIQGSLTFDEQDLHLVADGIEVTGKLQIGSATQPFAHRATITLQGKRTTPKNKENDGVSRGLTVNGGTLALYGPSPLPTWTALGDHLASGAKSVTLKQDVSNWRQGDRVVVAPTDYYGQTQTEAFALSADASGAQLSLDAAVKAKRWGRMQYMTAAGLSLTPPSTPFVPPEAPAPTTLDERAEVANLSRSIVIEGADDADWSTYGFGAHVMIMGHTSQVALDGVEIRRAGQAGVVGRYPLHWHLLSYDVSTGAELGDVSGHFLRNSSIWNSKNRCVVIHGTNGLEVKGNICNDVRGHAFFLEDAVERRNTLQNNLALTVRNPSDALKLKAHEVQSFNESGSSGFWITHPDNTVTNNVVADAQGPGVWLAFPTAAVGLSRQVAGVPRMVPMRDIGRNTVHSNGSAGTILAFPPKDTTTTRPDLDPGSNENVPYNPMKDGVPCKGSDGALYEYCGDQQVTFTVKGNVVYKNGAVGNTGAYRNQVMKPDYLEWTTADNAGVAFAGTTLAGSLKRTMIIGTSLNIGKGYPSGLEPQAGLATYHSSLELKSNILVGFGYVDGQSSGAFMTNDYYLRPVEKGTVNNSGNLLIKSHAGYRTISPGLIPTPNPAKNWALASALWDPYGYWGPARNFVVFNTPFLTAGRTCKSLDGAVSGDGANGKSCAGEYFGVAGFQTEQDSTELQFTSAINVDRYGSSGELLGHLRIEDGALTYRDPAVAAAYSCSTVITPPPGNFCSIMLGSMRHFAAVQDNRYVLTFPTHASAPRWVSLVFSNAYRAGDSFVMAVHFDGRFTATGYTGLGLQYQRASPIVSPSNFSTNPGVRYFQQAASLSEVLNDTVGNKIWQDKTKNLVWFRHLGNSVSETSRNGSPDNSDYGMYAQQAVVLLPANANCAGLADGNACLAKVRALKP